MLVERKGLLNIQPWHNGETAAVDRVGARTGPAVEEVPGLGLERGGDLDHLNRGIDTNPLEKFHAVDLIDALFESRRQFR